MTFLSSAALVSMLALAFWQPRTTVEIVDTSHQMTTRATTTCCSCGSERTNADGTLDYAGPSGNTTTNVETATRDTVTLTGNDADYFEGPTTWPDAPVYLEADGSGTTTWPNESGTDLNGIISLFAEPTIDVHYKGAFGQTLAHYTYTGTSGGMPEYWTFGVPRYTGNITSVVVSIEFDFTHTLKIENLSTVSCRQTWVQDTSTINMNVLVDAT